ncbi:MAG: phage major capsid protein [Acidimicrobiia bacterium]
MTTAAPAAPDQLEELLGDHDRIQNMLANDPDTFRSLVSGYVKNVNDRDQNIRTQVAEQVQAGLAEFYKETGAAVEGRPDVRPDNGGRDKGQGYNRHALGAKLDGVFDGTGDLLQALWQEKTGNRAGVERMSKLRNDYSSTVPSEGGFLVPEEFRAELLRVALESAIVRPRARVIPMGTPRIKFPAIDSTSNASSVYGGIIGYWSEEGATLTASSAKFSSITLDAQKLTGYAEVPNELLADSAVSVSAFIDQTFPEALAWFEDIAFLRGTGVGEPLGILSTGNTCAVSVAKESGQAADTIVWENLVKMFSRMLPQSLSRAVWVAHIDTFPELATMALSVGTGGGPIWLKDGDQSAPMSILGRPVIFTEKAETLGDLGDINLIDFGYYLIGDRQQVSAQTSEHFKFNTDTTAYRIIQRVDGRPWLKSAITPNKGSNTLSPVVKLAARA